MNLTDHAARRCTAAWIRDEQWTEYGHRLRLRVCVAGHDVLEVEALAMERPVEPATATKRIQRAMTVMRTCDGCKALYEARSLKSRWCPTCKQRVEYEYRREWDRRVGAVRRRKLRDCLGCGKSGHYGIYKYCPVCRAGKTYCKSHNCYHVGACPTVKRKAVAR